MSKKYVNPNPNSTYERMYGILIQYVVGKLACVADPTFPTLTAVPRDTR